MEVIVEPQKLEDVEPESDNGAGTTEDMTLRSYLNSRPEIGLGKVLANLALEPREPFKQEGRRSFRKGFVITLVFSAMFLAWFLWFNFIR